ncbi:hypothetical protein V6N11_063111 [Hibiscus sabdariffa]|uniref:Uncharacterized protein n=1 Tax=Hibiscus sabdariffa TaxID=183260 RepID=A0ABR2NEC7_9ROSI
MRMQQWIRQTWQICFFLDFTSPTATKIHLENSRTYPEKQQPTAIPSSPQQPTPIPSSPQQPTPQPNIPQPNIQDFPRPTQVYSRKKGPMQIQSSHHLLLLLHNLRYKSSPSPTLAPMHLEALKRSASRLIPKPPRRGASCISPRPSPGMRIFSSPYA